ncbi:MAG: ribonuclease E activity regulator RraA [Gammaproteobacteria bacterium]
MEIMTADICDEHADRVEVAEPILRHFGKRKRFHGPAVTLKVHEDNVLVARAVETPGDGRILVVDGGGSCRCALLGDRLAGLAADNGWSGLIINGCIRDSAEIAGIGVGVLALATNPLKSKKNGDGQTATSVSFAGVTIRPDDYLYADEDGWLVAHEQLHQAP